MAHYETIEINAQALRKMASDIRAYTQCQTIIVSEYIKTITAEACEISIPAYHDLILGMRGWLARMEEIKQEGDSFAQYLCDRAEAIERMERGTGQAHTLREIAAGVAAGVIMHNSIRETDQGYQTKGASTLQTIASGMVSVAAGVAGVNLSPSDQTQVDNAIDGIVRLVDGQMAITHPEKRIDRNPAPIPQEQIDSHTLEIDPP